MLYTRKTKVGVSVLTVSGRKKRWIPYRRTGRARPRTLEWWLSGVAGGDRGFIGVGHKSAVIGYA